MPSAFQELEKKTLLLFDHCTAHPPADILKSKDGKIKAMYLLKNTTALIQLIDQGTIQACKAHYCSELHGRAVNTELQLKNF
jgi:hypothetical protein